MPALSILRRGLVAVAAVLLLAATALGLYLWRGGTIDIHLDEAQLQQRLAPQFPFDNCTLALGLACFALSEPRVRLVPESTRIGLSLHVVARLAGLSGLQAPGDVSVSGRMRFEPRTAEFFIDDLRIETLQLEGVNPGVTGLLRRYVPGIVGAALERYPVWSLRGLSPLAVLARLAVQDVAVIDGRLRLRLAAGRAAGTTS